MYLFTVPIMVNFHISAATQAIGSPLCLCQAVSTSVGTDHWFYLAIPIDATLSLSLTRVLDRLYIMLFYVIDDYKWINIGFQQKACS